MRSISAVLFITFLVGINPISTKNVPKKMEMKRGNSENVDNEDGELALSHEYKTDDESTEDDEADVLESVIAINQQPEARKSQLKNQLPGVQKLKPESAVTDLKSTGVAKINKNRTHSGKQKDWKNFPFGRMKNSQIISDSAKKQFPKKILRSEKKPDQLIDDENVQVPTSLSDSSPYSQIISSITSLIRAISNLSEKNAGRITQQLDNVLKRSPEENSALGSLIGPLRSLVQNKNYLSSLNGFPSFESALKVPMEMGNFIREPFSNFLEQALYVVLKTVGHVVNGVGEGVDAGFESGKDLMDSLQGQNSPVQMMPGVGTLLGSTSGLGRTLDIGHVTIGGTLESVGNNFQRAGKTGLLALENSKMQKRLRQGVTHPIVF